MKIMTTGTLEVVVLAQVEGLNPSPQLPENVSQRTFEIHLHNEDTGARGVLRVGTQSGTLLGGCLSHGDDDRRPQDEQQIGAGRDAAWAAITAYREATGAPL
jgi:hypothetical protein